MVYQCLRCMLGVTVLLLTNQLSSQTISHETSAGHEQLLAWLQSGDPRLAAWAATLARERNQNTFIALLPEWLKQSPLIRDYGYSPRAEDRRIYDAVLDALIRGNREQTVEPGVLRELGGNYPIQAFLLLARLPAEQQLPVLKEWFSVGELSREHSVLAKLAAMRLAQWQAPIPGFAALVLRDSEEQVTVALYASPNTLSGGWGMGSCGDSLARQPAPGWPVVYLPFAEEPPSPTGGNTLIALGDQAVTYRWVEENSPGGSCYGLAGLDQRTRHQIVAYWLGQSPSKMKWELSKSVAVVWTNRAGFDSTVGRLVEAEEESFGVIADRLLHAGLLSRDEAGWARPKLILRVVCHIKPCPVSGASITDEPPVSFVF